MDNGVFEINDFTIVTDIEHFADSLEGALQKFECFGKRPVIDKVENAKLSVTHTATVPIGPDELKVAFLQTTEFSKSQVQSDSEQQLNNSFTAVDQISEIDNGIWNSDGILLKFGVRECIIISSNEKLNCLVDENQTKTIMGAIKTVLHVNGCKIPVFCFIKNESLGMVEGYASDGNERIIFTTAVLRNINRRHCNMNELLFMFKEHLGVGTSAFHDEVRISTRLTDNLTLEPEHVCMKHTSKTIQQLAVGPNSGMPFDSIQISAIWNFFRENSLTENHDHSDFDLNYASNWKLKLLQSADNFVGSLSDIIGIYMDNRRREIRTDLPCKTILGKTIFQRQDQTVLDKITVKSTSDIQIGKTVQQTDDMTTGPISREIIHVWLDFIFDNDSNGERLANVINCWNSKSNSFEKKSCKTVDNTLNNLPSNCIPFMAPYKCAKRETLVWKLAVAMANIRVFMKSEPRAEPQIWLEFIMRLRQKYDNMIQIQNVENEIDHTQCLFSQKIQMLQLCINARRKRHRNFDIAHEKNNDEFFDANDTFQSTTSSPSQKLARSQKTGMMLIGNSEKEMYIPETQELNPLTDDMIDAKNKQLLSLTEDDRQEMQMDLVRSDMQSFKAANPEAVFADFLRWHSPRDYDEKTKTVSERMLIPNNIWIASWESAKAVPAANQTRIFNDTKIAEEIFEQLENATLDTIREFLKPTVFAASLERLRDLEIHTNFLDDKNKQITRMSKVLSNAIINNSRNEYCEVAQFCSQLEIIHSMRMYLMQLFEKAKKKMHPPYPSSIDIHNSIKQLINSVIQNSGETNDLTVNCLTVKPQEPIGRALAQICLINNSSEKRDAHSLRKEYIFVWNVKRPSTTNLKMTHRLYADLNTDSHRLYMSASEDANFFNTSYF